MDALIGFETSNSSLRRLRHLYDTREMHICSLKSLWVTPESYGGLQTSVLVKKLPQELQLFVSWKVSDSEWNLPAILKMIEEELQACERTVSEPTPTPHKRVSKEPPTAAALLTGTGHVSCSYCQQLHSFASCHVVTEAQARRQSLQRSGRCFTCLRRGHVSQECCSNSRCHKCGSKHHVSLCTMVWALCLQTREGNLGHHSLCLNLIPITTLMWLPRPTLILVLGKFHWMQMAHPNDQKSPFQAQHFGSAPIKLSPYRQLKWLSVT